MLYEHQHADASFQAERQRRRKHQASLFDWRTMSQAWKENFYEF
jgi:hypothetical protein